MEKKQAGKKQKQTFYGGELGGKKTKGGYTRGET